MYIYDYCAVIDNFVPIIQSEGLPFSLLFCLTILRYMFTNIWQNFVPFSLKQLVARIKKKYTGIAFYISGLR